VSIPANSLELKAASAADPSRRHEADDVWVPESDVRWLIWLVQVGREAY